MKFYIKLLLVSILVILVFFGYYIYTLHSLELSNIAINPSLNDNGMNFIIGFKINNPNIFPAYISSIEYSVVLEDTNYSLADGKIPYIKISGGNSANLSINSTLSWDESVKLTKSLLTKDKIYIVMKGKANLYFTAKEFEERIDIKQYIYDVLVKQGSSFVLNKLNELP